MTQKPKTDWEAVQREFRAGQLSNREIASRFGVTEGAVLEAIERHWRRYFPKTEHGAESMAIALVRNKTLAKEMGWPEISDIERQVRIGRAICDIVLRHTDGSVTIIEVKNAGLGLRDYCTGIGQLAYQAVMAASDFQTYCVRQVLAMPGQFPVDVALACIAADVDMLPMPQIDEWVGMLCEGELQRFSV